MQRFAQLGREVKMMPAQYVKPYVKTNKNDAADAEAVYEAMCRATMHFVKIKAEEQQTVLLSHRVREQLMKQRTQTVNALRSHCTEFGVVARPRAVGMRKSWSSGSRMREFPGKPIRCCGY